MRKACIIILWCAAISISAQINVSAVIENARQALSRDDNQTALAWLDMVLNARPNSSRAYYYRAYAHFNMADYYAAIADCDSSITLNPFIVEVFQFRGLCKLHAHDWNGAMNDYRHTLEEHPYDESALFNLAICQQQLGHTQEAESNIDAILHRNAYFRRGYLFKAQLRLNQSDTLRALSLMDSALAISPADPQTWIFKGHYAMQHNDYQSAEANFTKALSYDNKRINAYLLRAECRKRLGRKSEALADEQSAKSLQKFQTKYTREKGEDGILQPTMPIPYNVPQILSSKSLRDF